MDREDCPFHCAQVYDLPEVEAQQVQRKLPMIAGKIGEAAA
jgi:hypothetical protein